MNGLSLCSGVGGLDLAAEIAFPGYRCIAGVENNEQAAKRFKLRFPAAKIFRDVVGFDGRSLHGCVDIVTAGWPCQPHSVAGKRKGTADERWIWPEIARILDECGAWLFLGENVSGLLRDADGSAAEDGWDGELDDDADGPMGGMGSVLRDLAALGFVSLWGSLRAADVGASHGRPRVFIFAYQPGRGFRIDGATSREPGPARSIDGSGTVAHAGYSEGRRDQNPYDEPGERASEDDCGAGGNVADPAITGLQERGDGCGLREREAAERTGNGLAFAHGAGLSRPEPDVVPGTLEFPEGRTTEQLCGAPLFAPGPSDPRWPSILRSRPDLAPALSPVEAALAIAISQGTLDLSQEAESEFHGLVDGVANWLVQRRPRLQCCGNGVVPLQAAAVFTLLARRAGIL